MINVIVVVSHFAVAEAGRGSALLDNVPNRMDTTATGPITISLELPKIEYTKGGTKLVSAILLSKKVEA